MISIIFELLGMLGKSNLRKLIYYQALLLSMAFFETISIVALGFFNDL